LVSTGALNLTGNVTSTWQIVNAPLTIQTDTSGDIVLASAEDLTLRFATTSAFTLYHGATARLAIDSSGNIGLTGNTTITGSVTTTANLAVQGNVTIDGDLQFLGNQNITGTGTLTINPTGNLYLQSGTYVDGSGNIFLPSGKKLSTEKLEFEGNITINASSSGATTITVTNEAGGVADLVVEGDIQIEGGKITLASGETIDAETTDQLRISASTSTLILINDTQRVAIDSQGMEVTGMTTTTDLYVSQAATIVGTLQVQATTTLAATTITKLTVSGPSEFQNNFTVSGTGNILFSTAGTITQTGTGQVTFAGNVDATNGLDVTNSALTTAAGFTVSGGSTLISGSSVSITPSGAITLTAASASTWKTTAGALTIQSAANLIATSTSDIILATAGSARMRLLSTGEIGVGTSTPTGIFEVATSTGASVLYVGKNGNVGIGTTAPVYPLDLAGPLRTTGIQNKLLRRDLTVRTGLLIPFYHYPWDSEAGTWTSLFNDFVALLKKYHNVPVFVIINPSNGPGTVEDVVWRRAIKRLQGSGAAVLGYVWTDYANRPESDVKDDIDQWKSLYPHINGICMDEMTNDDDPSHRAYYKSITDYAHRKGFYPVVGNPGAGTYGSYFTENTADIIVIWENDSYPSESELEGGDWEDSYREIPYERRAAIVYGQPSLDRTQLRMMQKYVGLLYITDGSAPSPWGSVSSYLEDILLHLAQNQPDIVTFTAAGNVGIGTTTPSEKLTVVGNISGTGNIVISGTIDTGQGATEVYLMNQNLRTTDSPTFQPHCWSHCLWSRHFLWHFSCWFC